MISRISYLYWVISLVCLVASCGEKDVIRVLEEPCPIDFSVADFSAEVKGGDLTEEIPSFGVFATVEQAVNESFRGFVNATNLQPFMTDVPVKFENGAWRTSPTYYWPLLQDKLLSFFAYAPHSSYPSTTSSAAIVPEAGWNRAQNPDKNIRITYTLDPNPYNHIDLCVAQAVIDRVRDTDGDGNMDPVKFEFKHTLSALSFAANYIGTLPYLDCTLRIDKLVLGNVVNSNTLTYTSGTAGFYAWDEIDLTAARTGSYTLSTGDLTLSLQRPITPKGQNDDSPQYTEFVTGDGVIYALPQTINPLVPDQNTKMDYTKMDVTFSYMRGDVQIGQFRSSINLPTKVLEMGKKYLFKFTIDVNNTSLVRIECQDQGHWIVDWANAQQNHKDTMIK